MRGPLKAALLLAPALASALAVPVSVTQELDEDVRPVADHSFALVSVEVPNTSRSADEWASQVLGFRIDVLKSQEACGYGNITIDGQVLPQTREGNVLTGKGSISTERKSVIVASWNFHCIKVNGQPDAQLLKFVIDSIDGTAMTDVGFSVAFKQTGLTEIMNIETDLSVPDRIVANPNPEGLQPVGESIDFPQYDIETDIAELTWMKAQLEELKFLIAEKEQMIAEHMSDNHDEDIKDCDSLKCVMETIADKARKTAHGLYDKISGDEESSGQRHRHPKPTHKKGPKKPSHDAPKHGNGTHPGHPHKKPHFGHRPIPICRYPPPHHHHGPPAGPPHHGGPPHRPEFPGHGPKHQGPPPHRPNFDSPHHGPDHDERPHHGKEHDEHPHHGKEHDEPQHLPPHHDNHPHGPEGPEDDEGPHHPPHHDKPGPPPGFEEEQEHMGPHGDGFHPHPGPFDGPHGPPHGPGKALQVIKLTAIGFLFAFLMLALHRRTCGKAHKKARKTRKEERLRRRAIRRAAKKHGFSRFLLRFSDGGSDDDFSDYEEKREALLADEEDRTSTTMSEEISHLRTAASVVDDMVNAEEGRVQVHAPVELVPIVQAESSSSSRDFDIGSQVGDGEELPAYEDNDGTEDGSFVADGFRYTPGSSDYSPSQVEGSVSDILGPDTKQ